MKKFFVLIIVWVISVGEAALWGQSTEHTLPEAEELFAQADSLRRARQEKEAISVATEACDLYKASYGENSVEYGVALGRLGEIHWWHVDSENRHYWRECIDEGLMIVSNIKGENCDEYARLLTILAKYCEEDYYHQDNPIEYAQYAVNIRRKVLGPQHPDYAVSLLVLADCLKNGEHSAEALSNLKEAIPILRKHQGTHPREFAEALNSLARLYYQNGLLDEAINASNELLELETRIIGRDHNSTKKTMRNLVKFYREKGDELNAFRLQNELNEMTGSSQTEDSRVQPSQFDYMMMLAQNYQQRGEYSKAAALYQRISDYYLEKIESGKANTIDSLFAPEYLQSAASAYRQMGDYYHAFSATYDACTLLEGLGLTHDTTYVDLLNQIALYCYRNNNIQRAYDYAQKGIEILDSNPNMGSDNTTYVTSLRILSWCLDDSDLKDDAVHMSKRAISILDEMGLTHSTLYAITQRELAEHLLLSSDVENAFSIYTESLELLRQNLLHYFAGQSLQERKTAWNQVRHIFSNTFPQFSFTYNYVHQPIDDASALYDYSALFSKGLMLSTEISVEEQIQRLGDTSLMASLDSLRSIRNNIERLYENPSAANQGAAAKLISQADRIEKELAIRLKAGGFDFAQPLTVSWREVQQSLGSKDIAIEFITFAINNDADIEATLALTLRSDDPYPQSTLIIDSGVFDYLEDDTQIRDLQLYDIIWGKLADRLEGIENVYFSPSGPLHSLSIENLPGCEEYKFYRLTSTRELVKSRNKHHISHAVLYGGLNYSTSVEDMIAQSQAYRQDGTHSTQLSNSRSAILELRGAIGGPKFLDGTVEEVNDIGSLLNDKQHLTVTKLMGDEGNEESFKALSKQDVQLLHIATHGFYSKASAEKDYSDIVENLPQRNSEDEALSRSGLLLAGASNALEGDVPDEVEDGLLTAQEIAQIDLSDMDMVVLSACETALGDVSSSEGVFGLQRGFKKAGANSILMSLWKVDDDATCMLMTEFYCNWIGLGKTKHDALELAKEAVRNHPGWEDPKYWAAFILLDGLD